GLSKDEIVTLASIIEWETGREEEKATVAGVYVNRLRIGMKLDADPTIQYVVMAKEGQKRRLLYEDYRIEDPFNTYLRAGLPPAPITNPSPSSLRAAASPEKHPYLYFVATGDGTHKFSRTLAEHNRAAREYHDLMRERRETER
ncbi:MAG: endolytic transglycosylase MltG, partial [Rhodothermales bacterium]